MYCQTFSYYYYYYDTIVIGGLSKGTEIRISLMKFDECGKDLSTTVFSEESLDTIFVVFCCCFFNRCTSRYLHQYGSTRFINFLISPRTIFGFSLFNSDEVEGMRSGRRDAYVTRVKFCTPRDDG